MNAILITGNPGSGKTTVAAELTGRGCVTIDGDDLAHWETNEGAPVTAPDPIPDDWWPAHRWVWPRARLHQFITARSTADRPVYICGIAVNQHDLLDLFHTVFLLTLDHRTQLDRLNAPSNADRSTAARAQILTGRPHFEAAMRTAGAIPLDARLPPATLATRILALRPQQP